MMHREFVEQREWLTNEEFTELFGMVNLIPGPNSTELAMQIGRVRGGGVGLVVAGACFIVPAALLVTAFAVAYRTWGHAPAAEHLLYGIKPVIVAIVAQAVVTLLRTTVKSVGLGVIGAAAVLAAVFGLHPLAAVAASGLAAMAPGLWRDARPLRIRPLAFLLGLVAMLVTLAFGLSLLAPASRAGVAPIFLYFLKIGSVLYGSGYVLLAYLNVDLVSKLGWLTKSELLDAVAVGQFTPGPVFTTATFIGYLVAGPWGAVVATVGIFLPAFVFVAAGAQALEGVRESSLARRFMDGVGVASLALMAVVAFRLGQAAIFDGWTGLLAATALVVLLRTKLNSAWIVLAGGVIGLAVSSLRG